MTNKFKKCHLITIQEIAVSKQGQQAMPLKQGRQAMPLSTAMTHTYWTAPTFLFTLLAVALILFPDFNATDFTAYCFRKGAYELNDAGMLVAGGFFFHPVKN